MEPARASRRASKGARIKDLKSCGPMGMCFLIEAGIWPTLGSGFRDRSVSELLDSVRDLGTDAARPSCWAL
jgi:hypothetical protein